MDVVCFDELGGWSRCSADSRTSGCYWKLVLKGLAGTGNVSSTRGIEHVIETWFVRNILHIPPNHVGGFQNGERKQGDVALPMSLPHGEIGSIDAALSSDDGHCCKWCHIRKVAHVDARRLRALSPMVWFTNNCIPRARADPEPTVIRLTNSCLVYLRKYLSRTCSRRQGVSHVSGR